MRKLDEVQPHPFFPDIQLHTDAELAALLGTEIRERETIHQWPLSCVQRVLLSDGRKLVYKSQLPPTVEVAFYERARTPLLPGHQSLGKLGGCDILLLDWIEAPLLYATVHSEVELVQHGRRLIAEIGQIKGDLPVYLDIGSRDAWNELVDAVLRDLQELIEDSRFPSVSSEEVGRLREWAASGDVIAEISSAPRVCHGDLLARQIFVVDSGYRIVDWQRPVIAPPEIDLVSLLGEAAIDPRRHVSNAVSGIFWFLHLHWAVKAQHELFPAFRGPLFDHWAMDAIRRLMAP